MVLSYLFAIMVSISVLASLILGNGSALASSIALGAQNGITLATSLAGPICLWMGIGKLMEKLGFTEGLAKILKPVISKVFPSTKRDKILSGHLSSNICANFLGLGNAATPMGILAAKRLAEKRKDGVACNELCRLIVLNTASIQLIPTTVAAVRSSLGCLSPFDILPAVWITSLCSAGAGLTAAWCLGRVWK